MKFNDAPYSDSYSKYNDFYKVLFKPGYNLQARELNELQSMLQYQIGTLGNHVFKNGARIAGCSTSFLQRNYVRLAQTNTLVSTLGGYELIGADSGVEATIITALNQTNDDSALLLVIYTKTGSDKQRSVFIPGESIDFYDKNGVKKLSLNAEIDGIIPACGKSLSFNIEKGIFFYNDQFINVNDHCFIIEKYLEKDEDGNIVSDMTYRVGLDVIYEIVDCDQDPSLLDPHIGSPNFAGPGADRLKIAMNLGIREFAQPPEETGFISLASVRQNNTIEYKKVDTEYGKLIDEIARRTHETYNNFTVIPWKAHVINEKIDSSGKGWSSVGSVDNYIALVEPGVGYVLGNRIETIANVTVRGSKPRGTSEAKISSAISDFPSITVSSLSVLHFVKNEIFNMYNNLDQIIGTFKVLDTVSVYGGYKLYISELTTTVNVNNCVKVTNSSGTYVSTITKFIVANQFNDSLLFPISDVSFLKSLSDIRISMKKQFTGSCDALGKITIIANGSDLFIQDPGSIIIVDGVMIPLVYESSGSTLTINAGAGNAGKSYSLLTSLETDLVARSKTTVRSSYQYPLTIPGNVGSSIYLDNIDVYNIESVILTRGGIEYDITKEYNLDTGQTDLAYNTSSMIRNVPRNILAGDTIHIEYDYFDHGAGHCFTVESYPGLSYTDVPTYDNNKLSDFLDFRGPTNDNFPSIGSSLSYTAEYYVPRIDMLMVNSKGSFYIKTGVACERPVAPSTDADAMSILEIHIDAGSESINTRFVDNKIFQMKQIAKIENKISKLEDGIALSSLENNTINMSIKDSNGLDRYKNGFLVDNFKGYYSADLSHNEFKAGLNRTTGELRPQFSQDNVTLEIDMANSSNIVLFGNMAIADFDSDLFISNKFATQSLSINPYMIFRQEGTLSITPNIDTWSDVTAKPTIVTTVDSGLESLSSVADSAKMLGTDYGTWVDLNTTILTDVATSVSVTPSSKATTNITTKTQTVDSTRTTKTTELTTNVQSYNINDVVKDVSIIPYMRSKTVQFYCSNMKPNTQLYAYFDGINVTEHCKKMQTISSDGNVIVNRAHSIFGASPLVTDDNGNLNGEFRIPANTFFTGEKRLVFTNDPNNTGNVDVETTRCFATYFAGGVSQSRQSATLNVITPGFSLTEGTQDRTTTTLLSRDSITTTETYISEDVTDDPIAIDNIKKYFYDNYPYFTTECIIMNSRITSVNQGSYFNIIPGSIDNAVAQSEANAIKDTATIRKILADIENIKVINRTTIEVRCDEEWSTYERLLKSNSPKLILSQIKTYFANVMESCTRFYMDSFVNTVPYKNYTKFNKDYDKYLASHSSTIKLAWAEPIKVAPVCVVPPRDPVAQGFAVEESCFISKVGVYFAATDPKNDVVWFEIREMINGYPSDQGICRKEVKATELEKYVSADASIEYQVQFSIPVYVDSSKTYAFVVGGYSPDTRLWISKLGDKLLGSSAVLEQPPLNFTMFRSLNGETWNAEQFTTMKFNLYRCIFKQSQSTIAFTNSDSRNTTVCVKDPIEVQVGSNSVRIYSKDHGFRANDRFVLDFNNTVYYKLEVTSGMPQIDQPISTTTGSGYIKDIKITNVLNYYEIAIRDVLGVFVEGQQFTCETRKKEYRDLFLLSAAGYKPDAVVSNIALGFVRGVINAGSVPTDISGAPISLFTKEHIVRFVDTMDTFIIEIESAFLVSGKFGGSNILLHDRNIKYDMLNLSGQYLGYNSSESWKVFPCSVDGDILTEHRIMPMRDQPLDTACIILSNGNESRILGRTRSFNVKADIFSQSPYISPVFNVESFSLTTISNRIENVQASNYSKLPGGPVRFVSETDPIGGVESYKYVSNKVILENPARDMKIILDVSCSESADFDIYIKIVKAQDTAADSSISWIKVDNYTKKYVGSSGDFIEHSLLLSKNCALWNSNMEYISYRVKIVGKSSNSCRPVVFKNLRAIAVT